MTITRKNLLIINPNAGRGMGYRIAHRVETAFKERNWTFVPAFTYGVKHAVEIAKTARDKGYETVVAVGGDGTVNEVVNGIAGSGMRLGVVSIGTGNDYIKSVGIPKDIEEAVRVIISGKTRKVDLGKVEDRYFVNVLGIGFDAQVAEDLYRIKRLKGFAAYLYIVIKNFFFYRNREISVRLAEEKSPIEGKFLLISLMIGKCLGGKFYLAPDAKVDDGLFDVVMAGDFGLLGRFRHFTKVIKGRHLSLAGVDLFRSREVHVHSELPMKVHVDGEMADINTKHFKVNILKRHLNLLVP